MSDQIIIIGAGLAGVSAGCYAQMNGYRTEIHEMHSVPGGLVATWKRKGYLIDGGIHFLMAHKKGNQVNNIYREVGIEHTDRYPDMTTYMELIDLPTGFSVKITNDLPATKAALIARFPQDRRLIEELLDGAMRMRSSGGLYEMGLDMAPELMGPGDKLSMVWKARKMAKYMMGRYARPMVEVATEAKEPVLQRLLLNLFTPQAPEWLVMSLLAMVEDRQIGLISDSCTGFMAPMIERYQQLGGTIHYRSKVREVLTSDGNAVGVKLEDGSEHPADIVISAADGRSTIYNMLGGRFVDREIEKRYRTWDPGASMATVSLGIERTFDGEPSLKTIMLEEPLTSYGRPITVASLRIMNYGTVFAPQGKTLVQVIFDGDWNFWSDLRNDREAYDARKILLSSDAIDILETQYPGISRSTEVLDISTPFTYWHYTGNARGSIMGWAPPTDQMIKPLPRTLPGLDRFYMVGQWSMPGGSVPTCIASGRQVVQVICRKDGKRFTSLGMAPPLA